jgi:hypothetical protein
MFTAKRAVLCGLAAVALSACASTTKPAARSLSASAAVPLPVPAASSRGKVDNAAKKHYLCIRQHGIAATEPGSTEIQVGAAGIGPTIEFLATPGAAQYAQISGTVEGAEVIGSALLYPNRASASELQTVEACTALGVNG